MSTDYCMDHPLSEMYFYAIYPSAGDFRSFSIFWLKCEKNCLILSTIHEHDFFYSNRRYGEHDVINFYEFPCNSMKSQITVIEIPYWMK